MVSAGGGWGATDEPANVKNQLNPHRGRKVGIMARKSNSNIKPKMTFASLQVSRGRKASTSTGGRYSASTRRLTVPSEMAGQKVGVIITDQLVLVGGEGTFACHPTQHFVTIPAGEVEVAKNVTLEVAEVPATIEGVKMPEGMVAYKLPAKVAKKAGAKTKAKAGAKTKPEVKPEAEAKA